MTVETFVDEYGEKKYKISFAVSRWSMIVGLLKSELYPNNTAINDILKTIDKKDDNEQVVVTLSSMEAASVSRIINKFFGV